MKIAIIAPPWTILPATDYAGIESTIDNLTEKLIEKGHEVILFAPDGSTSSATIKHYMPISEEINFEKANENLRYYLKNLTALYASAKAEAIGVDIIHNFTIAGDFETSIPTLWTIYGPPKDFIVKTCEEISKYPDNYLISVSNRQRTLFSEASTEINFTDTIYKSINTDNINWSKNKENYFLFIGHSEQKQALELVRRVANSANKRLVAVMQGKENKVFKEEIAPWLKKDTLNLSLQFTEDLLREARYDLYRKAKCTFYINQWEEPFGMEMLESLASGTPVISLYKGAAAEVIENGKTGFLVETEEEMVQAVKKIDEINPEDCRKAAEIKFSADVISDKYIQLYRSLI